MSRQFSRPISRRSWRIAVASPVIAASAALIAALLIAAQGQATSASLAFAPLDSGWVIRSGSAKSDLLLLVPAARRRFDRAAIAPDRFYDFHLANASRVCSAARRGRLNRASG